MGLTKPRAYQIYDIDYKQSVRVVTTSNITLSGGAPNSVDGVSLTLDDRVLVNGQSTGSQNGIYYVATLGSGSNGTWIRSNDTNATGELLSGTVVMVTEGNFYADTQWKLTTNDPITIGSTALTFVQNYGVPYTAATTPPTQNLVIGSQWYNTNTDIIYEYQYDGTSYYWVDISSPAFGTNGAQAGTNLANGTSNVAINDAGGNVTVGVGGTNNVVIIQSTGAMSVSGSYQVNGKQAVNGPAFRAYIAVGQTITSGSQQKVTFGSETFDTNGNFASSRFTPTVEGYYQLNATVRISGTSGTGEVMITIWKNGSEYARGTNESGTEQGSGWYSMQVSDIAYANGTGDYFEIYIQQSSGGNRDTTAGQNISYFSGVMIRGA